VTDSCPAERPRRVRRRAACPEASRLTPGRTAPWRQPRQARRRGRRRSCSLCHERVEEAPASWHERAGAGRLTAGRRSAPGSAEAGQEAGGSARAEAIQGAPRAARAPRPATHRSRAAPERTRVDPRVERSPFRNSARTRPDVDLRPSPFRNPERTPLYRCVQPSPFRIPERTPLHVDSGASPCRGPERTRLHVDFRPSPFRSRAAGLARTPGARAGPTPARPPSFLAGLGWPRALSSRAPAGPSRLRGCDHPHAVRVLARAWLRALWRC